MMALPTPEFIQTLEKTIQGQMAELAALRAQLADVQAERDALKLALEAVQHIAMQRYAVASWRLLIDCVGDIDDIARAALEGREP